MLLMFTFLLVSSCSEDNFSDSQEHAQIDGSTSGLQRTCGHSKHQELLISDPSYKEAYEERMNNFKLYNSTSSEKALCANPVVIPVAVHYQGVNNPNVNCLIQLAEDQIKILNDDYQGTNSDINIWSNTGSSFFPGVSNGEACIEFVLVNKSHPNGYGLSNGVPAVTVNQTSGDVDNNWSGYINIFVIPNTGYLGYSPLGGAGNGDGVVIDASAFGAGNGCGSVSAQAPFNLGRTLTHEMGHYLLLDHIWGNGCGADDAVADTPNQNTDYSGCPNNGASSCGSTDMHMNYMDYVNDACMYMFSEGQANRMENYMNANLSNVIGNSSNVIGSDNGGGGGGDDPLCGIPTGINVNVLSSTSARLDWDDMQDAIRYNVHYRKTGTNGWTRTNVTTSSKLLNNLVANSTYKYRITTRCPQGWTSFSNINTFKTDSNGNGGGSSNYNVKLELTLDNYGSETEWELINWNTNKTVARGGPYNDGQNGRVIRKEFDLSNTCYTLFVDDFYGDGICCAYGSGEFKLLDSSDNIIAASNGRFSFYGYLDICVQGNNIYEYRESQEQKKRDINKSKMLLSQQKSK